MIREYETLFVVSPELDKGGIDNLNGKFKSIIQENGGKVIRLTRWGKRELSYRIKKFSYGFYVHLNYFGDGRTVDELQRNLRLNENVLRYLTVKLSEKVDMDSKECLPDADLEIKGAEPAPGEGEDSNSEGSQDDGGNE